MCFFLINGLVYSLFSSTNILQSFRRSRCVMFMKGRLFLFPLLNKTLFTRFISFSIFLIIKTARAAGDIRGDDLKGNPGVFKPVLYVYICGCVSLT